MSSSAVTNALAGVRALSRRKIETVTLTSVAALVGFGMIRGDVPARTGVTASRVQYLAAAASADSTVPAEQNEVMDLPDIEHPRVDTWVRRFTTDLRSSFATYLARKDRYDDMISGKLAARHMPQGLIYLAMIESGFNPTARSRVKATGLWQFMTATGREYGLTINRRVDERKNASRSTDAALKYLDRLYDRFGSWYLAAAAYNTGQGRVARVMKQVTGRTKGTDADYYRISSRLPRETRDYVPKLIAAARIGSDPARYGFAAD